MPDKTTWKGRKYKDTSLVPPHPRQLAYLHDLGYRGKDPASVKEAKTFIERLIKGLRGETQAHAK